MATFVLVHGAWGGGWYYARVARNLRAQGHDVFTPTLTGLGERAHLLDASVNLSTHVRDVVAVLECEELTDVVLAGHSYGGMVVTGVADAVPERIRSLVYIDAFVPDDGRSLLDYAPDDRVRRFLNGAASLGGYAMPPLPAELFNVNAADRAWVDRRSVPMPLAAFVERIRLSGRGQAIRRRHYIYASDYPNSPFTQFYERFKSDPAWVVKVAPCGHHVMVDMPDLLAKMLLEAA